MDQTHGQQLHPAQAACVFMERTELRGGEVESYAQTFNWLQSILADELTVIARSKYEDLTQKLAEVTQEVDTLKETLKQYENEEWFAKNGEVVTLDTDPDDKMGEQGAVDLDDVG